MSTGRLGAGDTAIQPTILNAKGDLIAATAADTPAALTVGANGTVLTAASGEATGLQWAAPAAGGKVLQVVLVHFLLKFQIQQALMLIQVSRQQLLHQQQQAKF
jgi:hypothetical protein